jgi:hypothetical protein
MRQSIVLKIFIGLAAMAAIGGVVVWVLIRFRLKLHEVVYVNHAANLD